jgi:hypothetical protein
MAVVDVAHGVVGLAESIEEVDEPVRKNSNLPQKPYHRSPGAGS